MSVLSDLEKQLGIQPVNLSWDNTFKNKCWLDGVDFSAPSPKQKSQPCDITVKTHTIEPDPYVPDKIDETERQLYKQAKHTPDVARVAARLGTTPAVITNIYTQIYNIKNASTDSYLRGLCTQIIDGIKYDTITKQQCNALISEINSLTGRK